MYSDKEDKKTLGSLMAIAAVVHKKEVTELRMSDLDGLKYEFSANGALDRVLKDDRGYVEIYFESDNDYTKNKIGADIMRFMASDEAGIANISLEEFRRSSTYAAWLKGQEGISLEGDDEFYDAEDGVLESERSPSEPQFTVSASDDTKNQSPASSMLLVDEVIEKIKAICVGWTIDDKRPQAASGRSAERQGIIEVSGTVKSDNNQDQSVKFQVEKNKITTPNVSAELYEKMIKVFQALNPGKKIQVKVAPNSASAKALEEAIKRLESRGELKAKYEIVPSNKVQAAASETVLSRPTP